MAKSLHIDRVDRTPLAMKAADLLAERIRERSRVDMVGQGAADCRVVLSVKPCPGRDGFRIEQHRDGAIEIAGHDEPGLLYGVGKFLRGCRFAGDGFVPATWRGVSAPAKEVRGMYFATHFHNFYHDAPVAEIERYVADLALWGCNALSVWFDMHHYADLADPAARAMIERLHAILDAARHVGIELSLCTLANEAYASSPAEMRADWTAGHDGYLHEPVGHYHVEICPHQPGGLDLILHWRREMLQAFRDLDIRYVWLWPYDQGGCTCAQCAPWGINGFLKTVRAIAPLVRQIFPAGKTVLSTWDFDVFTTGEWDGITAQFARQKPSWVDYLMADAHTGFPAYPLQHGVPGGLPLLNFPELSMQGMSPWGGFGANPRPRHWQDYWDHVGHLLVGGFPYSEGIYEDLNKVLMFQLAWDPTRRADDIVREYAGWEYAPDAADAVAQAATLMEESLGHNLHGDIGRILGKPGPAVAPDWADGPLYDLKKPSNPEACLQLLQQAAGKMTAAARESWRWRVLWLRAALDAELHQSQGRATRASEEYFAELTAIYHAENAIPWVAPPTLQALRKMVK